MTGDDRASLWWQSLFERMEIGRSTTDDADVVRGLLEERAQWIQHRCAVDAFVTSWQSAEALVLAATAIAGHGSPVPEFLIDDLEECLDELAEDDGWCSLYS